MVLFSNHSSKIKQPTRFSSSRLATIDHHRVGEQAIFTKNQSPTVVNRDYGSGEHQNQLYGQISNNNRYIKDNNLSDKGSLKHNSSSLSVQMPNMMSEKQNKTSNKK